MGIYRHCFAGASADYYDALQVYSVVYGMTPGPSI